MRCIDCTREREFRTLYCPDCMAAIIRGVAALDEVADAPGA
jgi:hypothetical protein